MNKIKISIISISVLLIIFFYFKISNNLNLRIKISSWLSIPNMKFVDSNNIDKLHFDFNNVDLIHFHKLYKNYYAEGLGIENQKFQDYYTTNNKWRESFLTINNEKFKVKIKGHGKTPYAHKYGDHFSMSIKFIEKPYPYYSKRVNLIIYNRLQLRSESIKLIAQKLDLPTPKFKLVYAETESDKGSLYFIEERINKNFFSTRGKPWVLFENNINASLIYHGINTPLDLTKLLIMELEKRKNISVTMKKQILQDYSNFNNAILNNDIKSLINYLDIDYCARINAFRIINGDDGHGFNSNNFEMAYDTINASFYPIVHRDNNGTKLKNCQNPFPFMDSTRVYLPFFVLIDSDNSILKLTQEKIDLFLHNYSIQTITEQIDSINNYYKQSHLFEFSSISDGTDGYWIVDNLDCLSKMKN